jgi:high-affinity iron transporter
LNLNCCHPEEDTMTVGQSGLGFAVLFAIASSTLADVVTGRVDMPAACAPEVSPAVVRLEPIGEMRSRSPNVPPRVSLVNQRGLRFDPRVVALTVGQPVRFANDDTEQHNIHILTPGVSFNQSMRPGQSIEFVPKAAGVLKLGCDVHLHMRGYLVVGSTPWVAACDRNGEFRFDGVPDGRYRLVAWHEMGDPVVREVTVHGAATVLPTLVLATRPAASPGTSLAPIEPWSEVLDRISLTLARSLEAARRPGGRARAVTLAQDAYFGVFEASDLETAVRSTLGIKRIVELESQFRAVIRTTAAVADGKSSPAPVIEAIRALFVKLARATHDLNAQGVTDRSKVLASLPHPSGSTITDSARQAQLLALDDELDRVRIRADQGQADAASIVLGDVYFESFEPIETDLRIHNQDAVRTIESHFNNLRGDVARGLKGEALAARLATLRNEIHSAVRTGASARGSAFGLALTASFITIVREGLEVMLLLTMLFSLVGRVGNPRALLALRGGVALAVVASALTAIALYWLVGSTRGRARETLEGFVLLAAAGVLFYVSYWLIAQSESRRWLDFIKRQALRGAELGGCLTLGFTAFLAVYREGAETALMYQAMVAPLDQMGRLGVVAGLALGLVILCTLYVALRRASGRLPLRRFFQASSAVLFAMAVVFAGHGVFELQSSRIVRSTAVSWLGDGLPALGLYPNVQCLSVQAILLSGALLAMLLMVLDRRAAPAAAAPATAARLVA